MKERSWTCLIAVLLTSRVLVSAASAQEPALARGNASGAANHSLQRVPAVSVPPESFFAKVREGDREAARQFYKKYIDVQGMPVVAAAEVADEALQRTYAIVTHMLAGRPDVLDTMV